MAKVIQKGPKRGVSIFSYWELLNIQMDLEDCFKDMYDMGATGIEILANGHVDNYPYPSDAWVDEWFRLCNKYNITPVEYGHWIDCRLYKGRNLTTEEAYEQLAVDIKLASKLGFTVMRTKQSVIDDILTPVENWREIIKMALPLAERYNVKMCPEIHGPTRLDDKMVTDFVEFIEKENTKWFGLNIDFGVFEHMDLGGRAPMPGARGPSEPEDIIPLLPYVYCCHAKFRHIDENFTDSAIPHERVIQIMKDHSWDGYLLSEYEGRGKQDTHVVAEQLRRHHIMMKRVLGY